MNDNTRSRDLTFLKYADILARRNSDDPDTKVGAVSLPAGVFVEPDTHYSIGVYPS